MNKFRRCNNLTNVDIDLNNAIVTYKTVSRIFLSVVEFLSYNRNQIPLVYDTFNKLVQNLEKASGASTGASVKNFTLERQREIAIRTNQKFQDIFHLMLRSFKAHEFRQGIIVFGATIFTSKEAFVINLPCTSKNHLAEILPFSVSSNSLLSSIRSIITSTEFFDAHANELKPTNMYVLLKSKHQIDESVADHFERHEYLRLPRQCRITKLDIRNDPDYLKSNCCHELQVFSESAVGNANPINAMLQADLGTNDCNPERNLIKDEKVKTDSNCAIMDADEFLYECKISINGFRDQLNNGKSIWS